MNEKLKELLNRKDNILRNITLNLNDIDGEKLTNNFYNRNDISENRKDALKDIEFKIKNLS